MQTLRLASTVVGKSDSGKLSILEIETLNNNRAKYDQIITIVDLLVGAQGYDAALQSVIETYAKVSATNDDILRACLLEPA